MGVDGYSQMKSNLQSQLAEYSETGVQINDLQPLKPGMDMAEIVDSVFAMNIQILKDTAELITEDYEKAFEVLLKTKKIIFFAIGDAEIPCKFAEYKFRKLGYTCCADLDADMQIIDACNMGKGDVAIAISHSGNSRQVVEATKIAKERGATTICITKLEKSELIKWCDIKLFTAMPGTAFEKEVIARRIAEQAILESLYLGILERTEPGSGQKLKTLSKALRINKI
jgi:DNA-binding MurR/RpiR family transcriptional regulator